MLTHSSEEPEIQGEELKITVWHTNKVIRFLWNILFYCFFPILFLFCFLFTSVVVVFSFIFTNLYRLLGLIKGK